MLYKCKSCRYHFESKEKKEGCPYCGNKASLAEIADAEDLVGENNE